MIDRRGWMMGAAALALGGGPAARLLAAGSAEPIVSPIALDEGRLLVAAFFGKKGPYLFAIDSGAELNLIADGPADEIGLRTIRGLGGRGIGGSNDSPSYSAEELIVGSGLRMRNVLFQGVPGRISRSAIGALDAGLLTSYPTELDFVRSEWRIWTEGKPDRTGLVRLPSRLSGPARVAQRMFVEASIGAMSGDFMLDTGATGELLLGSAATRRSGLWDDSRPYVPQRSGGIGRGSSPARLVRAERMKIGPFVWEKPIVKLTEPGNPLGEQGNGLIGLRAIRRLNLSIDPDARAIWGAPNGLEVPPDEYGRSGLWVEEARGGIEITDVGTGSPAAAAGLRKGDLILGEAFEPFLKKITAPAGSRVAFDYSRGGTRARAELVLADFL